MKIIYSLLFVSVLTAFACTSEEEVSDPNDPKNIEVNILNYDDGSGVVVFSVAAENATTYEFISGEQGVAKITNATGTFEYTYKESGIYTVELKAIGANDRYLRHQERVTVQLGTGDVTYPGYNSPLSYDNMSLVWSDEFNGDRLNLSDWSYENGTGCPDLCGWGNNELEFYKPENSWVANGLFTIEARAESHQGSDYTSTKVITRDKQSFLYGRYDIRAKLPKGQGLWPAVWMLGQNFKTIGWPSCGEIDIMEMVGGNNRERQSHGNMFWEENGTRDMVGTYTLSTGRFYDEFHVFSLIWNEQTITWLVDDQPFHTIDITSPEKSEFHKPFYIIMNVAVGGNWPGSPDATTVFPTQMEVDYVRVFQFN